MDKECHIFSKSICPKVSRVTQVSNHSQQCCNPAHLPQCHKYFPLQKRGTDGIRVINLRAENGNWELSSNSSWRCIHFALMLWKKSINPLLTKKWLK